LHGLRSRQLESRGHERGWAEKHTARVCPAPENNRPVLVLLGTQNLVELQREAVEMANVERAKVVVEGIVEEGIVDGEIVRLPQLSLGGGPIGGSLGALAWGPRRFGVGEQRVLIGGIEVGSEIQAIYNGQHWNDMTRIDGLAVRADQRILVLLARWWRSISSKNQSNA